MRRNPYGPNVNSTLDRYRPSDDELNVFNSVFVFPPTEYSPEGLQVDLVGIGGSIRVKNDRAQFIRNLLDIALRTEMALEALGHANNETIQEFSVHLRIDDGPSGSFIYEPSFTRPAVMRCEFNLMDYDIGSSRDASILVKQLVKTRLKDIGANDISDEDVNAVVEDQAPSFAFVEMDFDLDVLTKAQTRAAKSERIAQREAELQSRQEQRQRDTQAEESPRARRPTTRTPPQPLQPSEDASRRTQESRSAARPSSSAPRDEGPLSPRRPAPPPSDPNAVPNPNIIIYTCAVNSDTFSLTSVKDRSFTNAQIAGVTDDVYHEIPDLVKSEKTRAKELVGALREFANRVLSSDDFDADGAVFIFMPISTPLRDPNDLSGAFTHIEHHDPILKALASVAKRPTASHLVLTHLPLEMLQRNKEADLDLLREMFANALVELLENTDLDFDLDAYDLLGDFS
jgi:hypothetical protein